MSDLKLTPGHRLLRTIVHDHPQITTNSAAVAFHRSDIDSDQDWWATHERRLVGDTRQMLRQLMRWGHARADETGDRWMLTPAGMKAVRIGDYHQWIKEAANV